jgi:hypothetical protein
MVFNLIWVIEFYHFGFIVSLIYFIFLIIFKIFYEIYYYLYNNAYKKYIKFKLKCIAKYERFKEYSFILGFKGVICILRRKYRKTLPEYIEYYRLNLKNTRLGKIFGPIYNFLGL